MSPKPLCLPNGHRTSSDRIRHVKVHPGRSPSLERVYLEIYEASGLVYEGLVDLDRVAPAEAGEPKSHARAEGRLELLKLP